MKQLVKRKVTSSMTTANRTNSLNSTGPASERGQLVSRRNALKHWGRAETIRPLLAALEEEPGEFDNVREALYRSLAPRDEFEQLLVDDMADVHWRLRRMVRGEAAAQAKRRRERKTLQEARDARYDSGKFHDVERATIPTLGFAGLPDSPVKFENVLDIPKTIGELVRYGGFQGEVVVYLQQLYGSNPGRRASKVMNIYDRCYEERETADAAQTEANQAAFQEAIAAEIAWFERRAAICSQAQTELRAPMLEAELVEVEHYDPAKIAVYHERLERVFERKWRMLMNYREHQGGEEQESQGEARS